MDITIAILPFGYTSKNENTDLLIAGFQDDLILYFSKFKAFSVIAPASTSHIRDANDTETLTRLGIEYLISGRFRSRADRVHLGIQLTRAKDAKVIFASEYTESPETMLAVQDEIAGQIVNALRQQIDFDLLSDSYTKPVVNLAAYENYLLGMETLKKGGSQHDLKARDYFEAALAINPNYARAYTGLSQSYFNEWSCQLWDRWDVSQKGAYDYSLKALELDEYDYVALSVAGRAALFSEEYEKAEHYLRKAVQINPNDANNLVQVAFSMIFLGLAKEAEKLYLRACKLNPLHEDAYYSYASNIYFELGDFQKAIEFGKKLNPGASWVDFPAYMAAAYYHLADFDNMKKQWELYLKQFAQTISKTATANEQEALEWQRRVNPYRHTTNLDPFWKAIANQHQVPQVPGETIPAAGAAAYRLKGGVWEIRFQGKTILMKDAKGYQNILTLLQQPEVEVHCSELMGQEASAERGIEVLDRQAKASYQARIRELQADIAEAERLGQPQEAERLNEEYDALLDHLSSSLGLAGRTRRTATAVDKARSAVTLRIRGCIKKIEKLHPELARHFFSSVRTGTFCSYKPESPMEWEF